MVERKDAETNWTAKENEPVGQPEGISIRALLRDVLGRSYLTFALWDFCVFPSAAAPPLPPLPPIDCARCQRSSPVEVEEFARRVITFPLPADTVLGQILEESQREPTSSHCNVRNAICG